MRDKDRIQTEREREKKVEEESRIVFAFFCVWKLLTFPPCAHTHLHTHTQQHKHTHTERSHIRSARHKIGSWPSVLPWKPCQMPCCDSLTLNKRGNLMKLVSLYEKWDRKWNSLVEFHSSPSSISPLVFCFCLKKTHKYRKRRKRQIVPTPVKLYLI